MRRKYRLIETGRQLYKRFEQGRWFKEAQNYLNDRNKMYNLLGLVQHLFHNRALAPVIKDLLLLYYYVLDIVKGRYDSYSRAKLILIVALLIYIVSPLDFIPDWIPGAGFLDDAALLGYVVKLVDKELERYFKWSKQREKENPTIAEVKKCAD